VKADLASDGEEALAAADRRAYDVIFLDLQMPGLDGFEVARRLRQRQPDGGRPKIVALTANVFAEDRERCWGVGMDGYLAKPVDLRGLSGELARAIGSA
jgi:CheY-like chemotaxis protein